MAAHAYAPLWWQWRRETPCTSGYRKTCDPLSCHVTVLVLGCSGLVRKGRESVIPCKLWLGSTWSLCSPCGLVVKWGSTVTWALRPAATGSLVGNTCSPLACMGLLWVLWFPSTLQRCANRLAGSCPNWPYVYVHIWDGDLLIVSWGTYTM